MDDRRPGLVDETGRALAAAGIEAFRRADEASARALDRLALEEAERVCALAESGAESAMVVAAVLQTIACNGRAELERCAGNEGEARELLDLALQRLIDIGSGPSVPFALRAAAAPTRSPLSPSSFDTLRTRLRARSGPPSRARWPRG